MHSTENKIVILEDNTERSVPVYRPCAEESVSELAAKLGVKIVPRSQRTPGIWDTAVLAISSDGIDYPCVREER